MYKKMDVVGKAWEFSFVQSCPLIAEANILRYSEVFKAEVEIQWFLHYLF